MLELQDITFERNGKRILDHINLTINNDQFIAITGPNGSGKSTLAKIIMGILKPDSGKIIFEGNDITNLTIDERAKLGIAFAFQQPVKFKGITVFDILKIAANNKDLTLTEACDVLGSVGLCANNYINRELNNSLSGGELKRIEIATISLRESKLTIFDEPEAGIDLWSFQSLIQVFTNLRNKVSGTTLIITHQEKILNVADTIILLNSGKIQEMGSRDKMLNIVLKQEACPAGGIKNEYCR